MSNWIIRSVEAALDPIYAQLHHHLLSTVFCTLYKVEEWHARLGGGVLADSIMDRIIHRSFRVYSGNINMRELYAKQN